MYGMRFLTAVVAGAAVLTALACGGAGTFVQPVPTTLTFTALPSDGLDMIITRNTSNPGVGSECSFAEQPNWCSNPAVGELQLDVQPSYTLYHVYVRNTGANDRVASIRVTRRNVKEVHQKAVPAGATVWFWELGIETVRRR